MNGLNINNYDRKTQVQLKTGEYKWLGENTKYRDDSIITKFKLEDKRENAKKFRGVLPPFITSDEKKDYLFWKDINSIKYFFEEDNWVVEFRRNPHKANLGVFEFYLFKKYKEV